MCCEGGCAWQRRGHAWHREGVHREGACVAGGRVCMARGCMTGGVHGVGGMCGRRDGHCSGLYASYWNAFLFKIFFHRTHNSPLHGDTNVMCRQKEKRC